MKFVIIVLIIYIIFQMGIIFFLLKTRKELSEKYQKNLNDQYIEQMQHEKKLENVQQAMDSIISSVNTIHLYAELIGENISSESVRDNINIVIAELETITHKVGMLK